MVAAYNHFWEWCLPVHFIIFISALSWFWSSKPHNFLEERRPPHGDASSLILSNWPASACLFGLWLINTSMQTERTPSPMSPQSSFPKFTMSVTLQAMLQLSGHPINFRSMNNEGTQIKEVFHPKLWRGFFFKAFYFVLGYDWLTLLW